MYLSFVPSASRAQTDPGSHELVGYCVSLDIKFPQGGYRDQVQQGRGNEHGSPLFGYCSPNKRRFHKFVHIYAKQAARIYTLSTVEVGTRVVQADPALLNLELWTGCYRLYFCTGESGGTYRFMSFRPPKLNISKPAKGSNSKYVLFSFFFSNEPHT